MFIGTPEAVGSNTPRAAGRTQAATRLGPTEKIRHVVKVKTDSLASVKATPAVTAAATLRAALAGAEAAIRVVVSAVVVVVGVIGLVVEGEDFVDGGSR